eukprot:479253-Prorocentrum_minimum.AAC.3
MLCPQAYGREIELSSGKSSLLVEWPNRGLMDNSQLGHSAGGVAQQKLNGRVEPYCSTALVPAHLDGPAGLASGGGGNGGGGLVGAALLRSHRDAHGHRGSHLPRSSRVCSAGGGGGALLGAAPSVAPAAEEQQQEHRTPRDGRL